MAFSNFNISIDSANVYIHWPHWSHWSHWSGWHCILDCTYSSAGCSRTHIRSFEISSIRNRRLTYTISLMDQVITFGRDRS